MAGAETDGGDSQGKWTQVVHGPKKRTDTKRSIEENNKPQNDTKHQRNYHDEDDAWKGKWDQEEGTWKQK